MIGGGRVLVVGGAPHADAALYADVLARAQVVIAVDGGCELCRAHDRVPDHLVGDFDSIDARTLEWSEVGGAQVHPFDARKDFSDLDAALGLCLDLEIEPPLEVTAVAGGRADHFLAVCGSLARHASLVPVVVEPEMTLWILSDGGRTSIVLSPRGALFSVVALLQPAQVSIAGARYPLTEATLEPLSSLGVSNIVAEERSTITVTRGTVAVIAPVGESASTTVQDGSTFAPVPPRSL